MNTLCFYEIRSSSARWRNLLIVISILISLTCFNMYFNFKLSSSSLSNLDCVTASSYPEFCPQKRRCDTILQDVFQTMRILTLFGTDVRVFTLFGADFRLSRRFRGKPATQDTFRTVDSSTTIDSSASLGRGMHITGRFSG